MKETGISSSGRKPVYSKITEIIAMSHYGVTPSKETHLLLCYLNFQRSGGFGGNIV